MNPFNDEYFMRKALDEAQTAFEKDEVPVGAVIVYKNKIIARGHNLCEKLIDFTAHAEMQVFTSASYYLQSKYLNECKYVTLEPCVIAVPLPQNWRKCCALQVKEDLKNNPSIVHPSTKVKDPC